jgi:hypothetical protein
MSIKNLHYLKKTISAIHASIPIRPCLWEKNTCSLGQFFWGALSYSLYSLYVNPALLLTIGKFPRRTPACELHVGFRVPYIYDYIMKLCRQQPEVIQNYENTNVRDMGKGESRHKKYEA